MAEVLTSNAVLQEDDVNTDKYALPRNQTEQERLDIQHSGTTEVLGNRLIINPNVQISNGCRVLDAGTGAASWLLALSREIPESVELVGTDISTAMFPKEVPQNVKLYETSTMSLPREWDDYFDFINQRMMVVAFTVPQWRAALSELKRVLKPGGSIQLVEIGYCRCLHGTPIPMTDRLSQIVIAHTDSIGLLGVRCGDELPKLLEQVGFVDVALERFRQPMGKHWGEIGMKGSITRYKGFQQFGKLLLAKGGLDFCSSQAELDERLERAKEEWDEVPGVYQDLFAITARKAPQEGHAGVK